MPPNLPGLNAPRPPLQIELLPTKLFDKLPPNIELWPTKLVDKLQPN
jgi:hypothetical protein